MLEDVSIAERAVKICWPNIFRYVKSFKGKPKSREPNIVPFSNVQEATQDPLRVARLHVLFLLLNLNLYFYLKIFQKEKPMLPFHGGRS